MTSSTSATSLPIGSLTKIAIPLPGGLVLTGWAKRRVSAHSIVVMLPSGRARGSASQEHLSHRLSWCDEFPMSHVVVLVDPVHSRNSDLTAAWFVDPECDVLDEVGGAISDLAMAWGVPLSKVLLYGSSVGGFAALHLAALLAPAFAIAEVPQVNLPDWPDKAALRELSQTVVDVSLLARTAPERLDVSARFARAKTRPSFLLITNVGDVSYDAHMELLAATQSDYGGRGSLLSVSSVAGHAPLPKASAVPLANLALSDAFTGGLDEGPRSSEAIQALLRPGSYRVHLTICATEPPSEWSALVALGSRPEEVPADWALLGWTTSPIPRIGRFRYLRTCDGESVNSFDVTVPEGGVLRGFRVLPWQAGGVPLAVKEWRVERIAISEASA